MLGQESNQEILERSAQGEEIEWETLLPIIKNQIMNIADQDEDQTKHICELLDRFRE